MQTRSETVAGTAEASAESVFASARKPLTLAGLPNHLLSSIFAQENRQLYEKKRFWQSPEGPTWVRHTFPLFCTSWSELYRSLNASLLHEMLQLDVWKEVVATRAREGGGGDPPRPRVVHASRGHSWAGRRAASVRAGLARGHFKSSEGISPEDLGALMC